MALYQRKLQTYDSDDDDEGTFQQRALEINLPGKNFDPNAVPTNGEEFLTFMAYERKNTPVVVSCTPAVKKLKRDTCTANEITPQYTANILNDQKCLAEDLASNLQRCTEEWKQWQLNHFEAIRAQAHALRSENFSLVSTEMPMPPSDVQDWLMLCSTTMPLLKETLTLGQRDLENLLEAIREWLQRGDAAVNGNIEENVEETATAATVNDADAAVNGNIEENVEETATAAAAAAVNDAVNDDKIVSNIIVPAENLKVTTPWLGQWLYAALVCLNLPLEPFVHSTMREIVRIFVRQRALLTTNDEQTIQQITTYNIFIHIIAKFFGQLDFAEFV